MSDCKYGIIIYYEDGRVLGPFWYISKSLRTQRLRFYSRKTEVLKVETKDR